MSADIARDVRIAASAVRGSSELPKYPIVHLPGSENWEEGHHWGNVLAEAFPDAEPWDFAYAICENRWDAPQAALSSGVVMLACEQAGENDGETWIWKVTFGNGETWRIEGWCDYTGWDCRSGIECVRLDPPATDQAPG